MDLPKVWCVRIAAREMAMSDVWPRVRITLDAMTRDELDCVATLLAEAMTRVAGDRDHGAFKGKYIHDNPHIRPLWL
jgi:hypothetical protein